MTTMHVPMSTPDVRMQSAMDKMNATTTNMHMTGNVDRDFMVMMIPHHDGI